MTTEDPALSPPTGTKAEELLEQLEIARAAREHARKVRAGKPVIGRWPLKPPTKPDDAPAEEPAPGLLERWRQGGA